MTKTTSKRKPHKRKEYERKRYDSEFKKNVIRELKRRVKEGEETFAACKSIEKDAEIPASTTYGWLKSIGKNLHALKDPYKFKKNEGVIANQKVSPCEIGEHEVNSNRGKKDQKKPKKKQKKTKPFKEAAEVEAQTPFGKPPMTKSKKKVRIEITANGAVVTTPSKTFELKEGAVMEFSGNGKIVYEI